jgi:hypothetical protein
MFCTLSHKRHNLGEIFSEHKFGIFFISSSNVASNNSHPKNNSPRCYPKCTSVFMPSTRYSCQILMKLKFSQRVSKNSQILSLMKIHPMRSEFFHANGQTDRQTYRQKNSQAAITNVVIGYPEIIGLLKFSFSVCKGCQHVPLILEFY